jgi:tryptophan synthase alpha chain
VSVATVLDADGRALIGYLPVGFPDLATSIDAAVALVENGVDALELGLPYSDPVMDGVAIQKATQTALAGGFRVRDVFRAVEEIRSRVDAPVLVMTYWNPVLQYGADRFADTLRDAGGAGLITPDITPDSAAEWIATSERTGLDRVFLAAPSSTVARIRGVGDASTRTCVGIGISTSDQVAEVLEYADGAIVGSALVTALAEGGVAGVARTASALAQGK